MKCSIRHLAFAAPLLALTSCYYSCGSPLIPCDEYPGLCNPLEASASLKAAESCDELHVLLRRNAIETMRAELYSNLVTYLEPRWCMVPIPLPYYADSQPVAAVEDKQGATQYSTTNTQEAGVDEADFVKNDGTYIYILAGGMLKVLQAWPAAETHEIGSIAVEGDPRKLYVAEDRAVVFSDVEIAEGDDRYQCDGRNWWGYCSAYRELKISVIDLTDRTRPQLLRTIDVNGQYQDSRRIGRNVHTVVQLADSSLRQVAYMPWDVNPCYSSSQAIMDAFYAQFIENKRLIEGLTLEQWLPTTSEALFDGGSVIAARTRQRENCGNFYVPDVPGGTSTVSVVSFDLTAGDAPSITSIAGRADVVYASTAALYVAGTYQRADNGPWFNLGWLSTVDASALHKFALASDSPGAAYQASGAVEGRLLNQFALGEHDGFLRLATTSGHLPDPDAHNAVFVLEQQGADLTAVGSIDHIAPGEDIRSARFVGDRGFVVTFKKTDPLFTIDLRDPRQPRIAGELKIPGFSTYLHMMDANHLLTIGFDAQDEGDFAWFQGILLQIFDVSDFDRPALTHKTVIGTRGSSSEATGNHLAFNYFAPFNLLALPMTICQESAGGGNYGMQMTFSGLLVYDVTVQGGFSERGRVDHPPNGVEPGDPYGYQSADCYNWWQDSNSQVKRSIIMDDYVFSISGELIKVNLLSNLEVDVASIPIPPIPQDPVY